MPKITFINEKKEIDVPVGTNLREAALQHGILVHHDSVFKKLLFDIPLGILGIFGIRFPRQFETFPDKVMQYVNCHGLGTCGTCNVHITKGMEQTSPMATREKCRLAVSSITLGNEDKVRLSCQTEVNGDIEVKTFPEPNLYGENFWATSTRSTGE